MAKRDKKTSKNQRQKTSPTTKYKSASNVNIKFDKKLSLVIPCYNEVDRIQYLTSALKSFDSSWYNSYEVIAVDDGSSDGTADSIEKELSEKLSKADNVSVIRLDKNIGKGGALQAGVAQATGDFILTLDADMAAKPVMLKQWLQLLPNHEFSDNQILIGSREHKDSEVSAKSNRKALGRIFNIFTQMTTSLDHKDTQCGFKLYPAAIAKSLFGSLSTKGWAHDVEVLYKAKLNGIDIQSMPVKWQHIENEKINVGSDGIKMAFQTLFISLREKFNWFFVSPFKGNSLNTEPAIYRLLFAVLMVVLLFAMPMLSGDYGISGDEYAQKVYGEFIVEHFDTDGEFKAEKADYANYVGEDALTMKPNLWLYGGGFDYVAARVNQWFPAYDDYDVRHFLNALTGFFLIFFTGLLGKELTNSWRMGFLAALLLALSPRIFGHSMMNPKDIPFAAAYILAMVNIIRIVKQLPNPSFRPMFYTALGIAFAISIRIGGLLLVGLLGLFVIIAFLWRGDLRRQLLNIPLVGGLALKLFAVIILGYLGGLMFWPYALEGIIANPLNALSEMTNFSTAIQMLFEGKHLWSDELPWHYIPKWQMMAATLAVLVGLGFAILLYFKAANKAINLPMFLTLFAGVFPVVYALSQNSAVYDGMRQFIFVYPIFVVLAAFGWSSLAGIFKNKMVEIGSMVVLAVFLYLPASWMIKNHPYQYIYINEAFGGVKKAATQYETDYWMTSAKGLAEWFMENIPEAKNDTDVLIALSDNTQALKHYFTKFAGDKVRATWVKYDRREDRDDWDYLISFHRFKNEGLIESGAWPLAEVIYEEKVDGVTIGSISKRTDKFAKAAKDAEKKGDFVAAIDGYKKALEKNPKNEQAHIGLINSYSRTQNYPEMKKAVDEAMKLTKSHVTILSNLGLYYLQTQDLPKAIETFEEVIDVNYKSTPAYYYLALAYNGNGESGKAVNALEEFARNSGNIPQGYQLAIQLTANSKYQQLYFQAKQAYFSNNFQQAYQLVQQSIQAGNNYELAVEFKETLDKAIAASQAQQGK